MKKCKEENCDSKTVARGLCGAHLTHFYKYGEVRRLISQGNKIVIFDNYAEIQIYDQKRKPKLTTKIDLDDIDKVINDWWIFNGDYVKLGTSKNVEYLHHRIMGRPPGILVLDHINRNKLDNRKSNLRFITKGENNRNR